MRAKKVTQSRRFLWFILPISLVVLGAATAITPAAAGQTESVIYKFQGGFDDGSRPYGALVADQTGNLYGATGIGGDSGQDCYLGAAKKGCGAIFELTPPSVPDGDWSEVLLYSFQGLTDGDGPGGPLVFDQAGNLFFGTTQGGGSNAVCPNCGTVFELSPPTSEGGAWKETVIHRFAGGLFGPDGASPNSGLVFDKNGNLYGTTFNGGGAQDEGSVFELSPPTVSGGAWKETVIRRFNFQDGANPVSSLIIHNGALYGMTNGGGLDCYNDGYGCGVVYKLVPPATVGDAWSEEVLYRFGQFELHRDDGTNPEGSLIFDSVGNLYGTTNDGGGTQCVSYAQCGTVFELSPPANGVGPWTETTVWKFGGGSDGMFPQAGLVVDSQGALYGTTPAGGSSGYGIVFKLVPAMAGVSWSEQVLHVFGIQRGDGEEPVAALLLLDGKFYGTTEQGGAVSPTCYGTCGTVFTVAP